MRVVTLSTNSSKKLENKVAAIKATRALSLLGLKEAKDLVERVSPSNMEVIKVPHTVLEPTYSDAIRSLREAGLIVTLTDPSSKVRAGIGDEIRKLVSYCTMAAQYDIAKALLDVMETYCPEPSEEFAEDSDDEELESN